MAHGALNLETLDWHPALSPGWGWRGLRWPEIVPHGAVVGDLPVGGQTHALLHAGRRLPVRPGGRACCDRGELSLNISTGSQASLLKPQVEFGDFQTRPFFDGRFLATHHPHPGRPLAQRCWSGCCRSWPWRRA